MLVTKSCQASTNQVRYRIFLKVGTASYTRDWIFKMRRIILEKNCSGYSIIDFCASFARKLHTLTKLGWNNFIQLLRDWTRSNSLILQGLDEFFPNLDVSYLNQITFQNSPHHYSPPTFYSKHQYHEFGSHYFLLLLGQLYCFASEFTVFKGWACSDIFFSTKTHYKYLINSLQMHRYQQNFSVSLI